jgi:hypothetical protein
VDFYRTRDGDVRPRLTLQPFRRSWSLAAGTGTRPRVPVVVPVVVIALVVALGIQSPLGGSRRFAHTAGPWVLALAYPSLVTATHAARELRRVLGESRRRQRGGAVWWRDRDWPTAGAERRIAPGIRAPGVPVALAVIAAFAYCVLALSMLGRMSTRAWAPTPRGDEPFFWGWVPASAAVVVAAWALPLIWLAVVVGPRLGRGRLVVAWPELPQRTGARVAFHVATSPGGARIDGVRVFLRCVRTRSRPLLPLRTWNARLAWVGEARLPLNAYVGPETHLRAEFDVPADAPSTDMHADDAVRWKLLVLGTVGAADYAQSVDVPVYGN